jgi:diaminopimelate epimerase
MRIVAADPAKNITVFVLDPVESPAGRAALARAIMADSRLGAEQVGFVIPPEGAGRVAAMANGSAAMANGSIAVANGSAAMANGSAAMANGSIAVANGPAAAKNQLWRLEMAGGEFCGNAARSFGLYVARTLGLKGRAAFSVSVSGAGKPVRVDVDVGRSRAAAEMPGPVAAESLIFEGRSLPVLVFEGITHVIAPDIEAGRETFHAIKALAESRPGPLPPAVGVMFYKTGGGFMVPAVYVRSADSLVFESSCGSGSAALAVWLSRGLRDGAAKRSIAQPGGVIETEAAKSAGEIVRVAIGGEVKLGGCIEFAPQGS